MELALKVSAAMPPLPQASMPEARALEMEERAAAMAQEVEAEKEAALASLTRGGQQVPRGIDDEQEKGVVPGFLKKSGWSGIRERTPVK
jgi:hypothetical protein